MPITASTIALGALKTGYGIYQNIKGNKLAKNNVRPTYEIPSEIKQNLTQAQMTALQGLPPEVQEQYTKNIQRSQQFGLAGATSRKGGLQGLGALVQQGNDAYGNLASMDAQAHMQNQAGLMNARSDMAGYKDKAFQFNQVEPYQNKAQAAQGLIGSGIQNMFGGAADVTNSLQQQQLLNEQKRQFDKQFPSTPKTPANANQFSNVPSWMMGGQTRGYKPWGDNTGYGGDGQTDLPNYGDVG